MKKLVFFAVAIFSYGVNAQDIVVAEAVNNGELFDTVSNKVVCTDNSVKIVVDLKKSNVAVTTDGYLKNYKVDKVEFYNASTLYLYCSDEHEKVNVFYGLDGYSVGISYQNFIATALRVEPKE